MATTKHTLCTNFSSMYTTEEEAAYYQAQEKRCSTSGYEYRYYRGEEYGDCHGRLCQHRPGHCWL